LAQKIVGLNIEYKKFWDQKCFETKEKLDKKIGPKN